MGRPAGAGALADWPRSPLTRVAANSWNGTRWLWRADGGHRGANLAGETLRKLVELMAHLRGPEGCPWDRAQEYDSVKGLLLEEAYEVVDAVNARDFDALEDELGDLLFQVVFYSQFAEEEKRFTIDDVVERAHAKLMRRHPHDPSVKKPR